MTYDYGVWVFVNTNLLALQRTATLPAITDGSEFYIKLDASSVIGSSVRVVAASGSTIDGAANKSIGLLSGTGGCLHMIAVGTDWKLMSYQGLL